MSHTITRQLAINALNQAIGRRRPSARIIHHPDRGSQYASHFYQRVLKDNGFITSMSRKGNCYDNACIESFLKTLKTKLVYHMNFSTRAEVKQVIFEYIEFYYNRVRLHSMLGYVNPIDYENRRLVA